MVDPAALANARLRRVEVKADKSAAALPQANEAQRFNSYFDRVREADLESWYPRLEKLTYPTTFIPLSVAEAKAILHRYEELSTSRSSHLSRRIISLPCLIRSNREQEEGGSVSAA